MFIVKIIVIIPGIKMNKCENAGKQKREKNEKE